MAFRALKNVISDRDEKKKQNKTKQNKKPRARNYQRNNMALFDAKKKKNDFGEI